MSAIGLPTFATGKPKAANPPDAPGGLRHPGGLRYHCGIASADIQDVAQGCRYRVEVLVVDGLPDEEDDADRVRPIMLDVCHLNVTTLLAQPLLSPFSGIGGVELGQSRRIRPQA